MNTATRRSILRLPWVIFTIWTHPASRRRRIRALGSWASWQLVKRLRRSPRVVTFPDGQQLHAYADSYQATVLQWSSGRFYYHESYFMDRFLRPGDAYLDVGAHIGTYTLRAARLVGPLGLVEAFEPNAELARRIMENVRLNELTNVTVHEFAVSSAPGVVEFTTGRSAGTNRLASPESTEPSVAVPATSLDAHLGNRSAAMVKLSIQGSEGEALIGATSGMRQGKLQVIQLETRHLRNNGWTEERLTAHLKSLGYVVTRYDADEHVLSLLDPWLAGADVLCIAEASLPEVIRRLNQGVHSRRLRIHRPIPASSR